MTQKDKAMTRFQFLSFAWLGQREERPRRAPPAARPPPLRPPGAVAEAEFRSRCTSCDDCLKACPHWVIRKAGPELGAGLAGTPVIVPADNPCVMCTGFPCAAACTTGALVMPQGRPKIGLAVVNQARCYSAQGQPCDYCHTRCPERPRAIGAFAPGQLPAVSAERCTGCGVCASICPAAAIGVRDARAPGGAS